jgi:hypothetical protein
MMTKRMTPVLIALFWGFGVFGCSGGADPVRPVDPSPPADTVSQNPPPITAEGPIWPISRSTAADADSVHSQYGPRYIPAGLDFHAGIDIPAPTGTSVHAVLAGTVTQVASWDGTSIGAGNSVTVVHPGNIATSYLHLHTIRVKVGDQLAKGAVVGTVGQTGATYPHLHLGYFVNLPTSNRNESYSRNPLELLPHGEPEGILAGFTEAGVDLSIPIRRMTVQSVELQGEGESRLADYYAVVARGSTLRKQPVQFGLRFTPGAGSGGRFGLDLAADANAFRADRVIVVGIRGDTLLDASRGGSE